MSVTNAAFGTFIDGLKSAYQMETQSLAALEPQAAHLENYPELQHQIADHLAQTHDQLRRLAAILQELGAWEGEGTIPPAPPTQCPFSNNSNQGGPDTLKDSFVNYAHEHFEIASYRSLIVLAETLGLAHALPLLEQTLAEEENMAQWLEDHAGLLIDRYLAMCVHQMSEAAGSVTNKQ